MKKVAAIVTEYRRWSHADVIVGKMLEGFLHDGKEKPNLRVVSMYVDQFPKSDLSRDLAKKYDFKICESISEALTLGGNKLAVEGVICIGEHGKYPTNDKGQTLYPRRRFFEKRPRHSKNASKPCRCSTTSISRQPGRMPSGCTTKRGICSCRLSQDHRFR